VRATERAYPPLLTYRENQMSETNLQVLLASRPTGWVEEGNFNIVATAIPEPKEGEVLVRNHYLSLDPYMRGRMNDTKSYAAPVAVGAA